MSKPRSDSVLDRLTEEQQAKLADWLLSALPYYTVVELVAKEFGVKTSVSALSAYYGRVCSAALLARRRRAVGLADDLMCEVERTPGQFDRASLDAIRQKAFEVASSPSCDPSDVKGLFMLILKSQKQELDARQVAVAERKIALLEKRESAIREVIDDDSLTPEEAQERIKAALGMTH